MDSNFSSVRQLRRHWKPTKERLADSPDHEPLLIRIHRACSWLQQVEEAGEDALDQKLIFQWVALNSLYGQWDVDRREPQTDSITLPRFLDRILELDGEGRVSGLLTEHKRLVLSIFEDEYLTKYFWEEPSKDRARQAMSTRHKAKTWFIEERWAMILARLMERIYMLRCQLVHGAATCGGKLNRTALKRCSAMMGHLLPTILLVLMDQGTDEDWGPLCYPPYPCR